MTTTKNETFNFIKTAIHLFVRKKSRMEDHKKAPHVNQSKRVQKIFGLYTISVTFPIDRSCFIVSSFHIMINNKPLYIETNEINSPNLANIGKKKDTQSN